jgi:hypothetical protein
MLFNWLLTKIIQLPKKPGFVISANGILVLTPILNSLMNTSFFLLLLNQ